MVGRREVVFAFMSLVILASLFAGFVSSEEVKKTHIILNTDRRINFTMDLINSGDSEVLQTIDDRADGAGFFEYYFYSYAVEGLIVELEIEKDGEVVYSEEFGPYVPGNKVVLDADISDGSDVSDVVEDTSSGESEDLSAAERITEQSAGGVASSSTTGFIVGSDEESKSNDIFYYAFATLVLVGAIFFLVRRRLSAPPHLQGKVSPVEKQVNSAGSADIHERIESLQAELANLKKQEEIEKIHSNIKAEQDRLASLSKGAELKEDFFSGREGKLY